MSETFKTREADTPCACAPQADLDSFFQEVHGLRLSFLRCDFVPSDGGKIVLRSVGARDGHFKIPGNWFHGARYEQAELHHTRLPIDDSRAWCTSTCMLRALWNPLPEFTQG